VAAGTPIDSRHKASLTAGTWRNARDSHAPAQSGNGEAIRHDAAREHTQKDHVEFPLGR